MLGTVFYFDICTYGVYETESWWYYIHLIYDELFLKHNMTTAYDFDLRIRE